METKRLTAPEKWLRKEPVTLSCDLFESIIERYRLIEGECPALCLVRAAYKCTHTEAQMILQDIIENQ